MVFAKTPGRSKIVAFATLLIFWSSIFYKLVSPISIIVSRAKSSLESSVGRLLSATDNTFFRGADLVKFFVFRSGGYDEILNSIVIPDAVNVMDNLIWKKMSSKFIFCDKSMLSFIGFITIPNCNSYIPVIVFPFSPFPTSRIRRMMEKMIVSTFTTSDGGCQRNYATAVATLTVIISFYHNVKSSV